MDEPGDSQEASQTWEQETKTTNKNNLSNTDYTNGFISTSPEATNSPEYGAPAERFKGNAPIITQQPRRSASERSARSSTLQNPPRRTVSERNGTTIERVRVEVNGVPGVQPSVTVNSNHPVREWSVGLFQCGPHFSCLHCLGSFICPQCMAVEYQRQMGEPGSWWDIWSGVCCSCTAGIAIMRTKLRLILGISGSTSADGAAGFWCTPCSLCQMKQELDASGVGRPSDDLEHMSANLHTESQ